MASDWSLLPDDLLGSIALKLDTFEDFFYFSAVCRCWNRVWLSIEHQWKPTPVPWLVPWLLLSENTHENPNHLRKIFNLANNKCYQFNLPETFGTRCWGSPYGWLVMASRDLSIRLFNPITKAQICFPSVEDLPFPPQSYGGTDDQNYARDCITLFLTKLILLQMSRDGVDKFVVMALYDENGCLAFTRQGDHSWTSIFTNKIAEDKVLDVAVVEDRVFALYTDGAIRYWNVNELDTHDHVEPSDYSLDGINILNNSEKAIPNLYLLQSSSKFLVVLRHKDDLLIPDDEWFIFQDKEYETDGFKVYQVNPIDKRWDEIMDLGEVALFVGNNSSMSVSALGANCVQCNCIYFTDDENMGWDTPKDLGGHDMGVYDIKYDKLWRFYEGADMHSAFCTPVMFIPQL